MLLDRRSLYLIFLCRLFETFDVVSDDVAANDRLQLLRMTAKCSTEAELGMYILLDCDCKWSLHCTAVWA